MAEPARRMLFKPELRKSLDGFVAMTQQLGRVKGLTNTSNTTPTMIGSGVIAAGGIAAVSHPMALAWHRGGRRPTTMARAWTSPKFVNLVTGYGRALRIGQSERGQIPSRAPVQAGGDQSRASRADREPSEIDRQRQRRSVDRGIIQPQRRPEPAISRSA
jgi:hypothetical protein